YVDCHLFGGLQSVVKLFYEKGEADTGQQRNYESDNYFTTARGTDRRRWHDRRSNDPDPHRLIKGIHLHFRQALIESVVKLTIDLDLLIKTGKRDLILRLVIGRGLLFVVRVTQFCFTLNRGF